MSGKSYGVAVLQQHRIWELYNTEHLYQLEARQLQSDLISKGTNPNHICLISGYNTYDLWDQLKQLNLTLLQQTIPGVNPNAAYSPEDTVRLYLERGYGSDNDAPYSFDLSGFNENKLIILFGRVARGEMIDDMRWE